MGSISRSMALLTLLLFISCASSGQTEKSPLADEKATPATVILYENLVKAAQTHTMFGHQDDLAYGVNWKYEPGRSDVKDAAGDYPAVYGWDLGGLEKKSDKNIDGIPFELMRKYIVEGHRRGGVITISWHMDNPLTGKNAWDTTPGSLAAVLPGGASHQKFVSWLDAAVVYLKTLKDDSGNPIPILFRPFHELTGTWFWWCQNNGTADDFKNVWKFTFDYLRKKGVHNLIYVYNTSSFASEAEFLVRYPGSAYADMLSFDDYQMASGNATDFIAKMKSQFAIIDKIARTENKPMAFAETGYEAIPDAKWWTGTLMQILADYPVSYVLVWRNHGWNEYLDPPRMHYYAPYAGHPSEADFRTFRDLPRIWFEKDAAAAKLYQKH